MKRLSLGFFSLWGGLLLGSFTVGAQTLPATNGLLLWLKADAGVTTNASAQVTGWADQSGAGNHAFQTTAASAPVLTPNSLNSQPTLRFTGSQYLEVPNAGGIDTLTNDVTILTVAKYDNFTGYRGVVEKCVSGAPAPFDWWNNATVNGGLTSFYLANVANANVRFLSTLAPPVGVYNVLGYRWKDGVVDQFLNDFNIGNAVYPGLSPTNGNTNLRIGRRPDGTVQLLGNVAEVLIYKPALADDLLFNVITNYLKPKYGLGFDLPPVVSITAPTNGATVPPNTPVSVSVSVSDPDGYVASLRVYADGALLGTAAAPNTNSSANYQLQLTTSGQGNMMLTATATDNYGRSITSSPVVLTVTNQAPSAPVAAGLKVWLAADAGLTTNASGAVVNWADQSGSGNAATQVADETAAPTLVANAVNGKPVLHFNGTNSYMEVPDEGTAFLTNDLTTYAVARFLGSYPALRQHVWSKCGASGMAGPVDWWLNVTTGAPFGYRGDGTDYAGTGSGTAGPVLGRFTALGMMVTAIDGVMAHYLGFADNGFSVALTNTANAGPLRIGRRLDGGTQLNGDLAEILIYDRALSVADRSNIVSYLSGKYGLVQASYASAPPVVSITSPTAGSSFAAPATVTFTVSASSPQGAISRVVLSANGNTFATLTAPPYQVALDLLTPGTVTFTAVAQDNWGSQTSTSVVATVTGSASTPLVTAGLRLQLAADLGVTTDGSGAVTAWADQSSSANNAAPTDVSTAPLKVANVLNGKPVIRFNGGNPGQFLEAPGDTSYTAGDLTTFAMVKFNNFSGTPAFRTIWTKTANNNLAAPTDWYFASSTGIANLLRGAGAAGTYGGFNGGAVPAGLFSLVGFKASGPAITHFLGYNITGSGTITQTPVDAGYPLRIGRRFDGGVQMNGDIAEILIYDRAVSESERLQIANYLYNKWGLTVVQLANKPPVVTLLTPTSNTPVSAPGVISVVAQVSDVDSPISRVDFVADGNVVASRTAPPYQIPMQVLTPGTMTLSVQAVDIWGAMGTSAPVVLTISGSGPAAPPSSGLVLWLKADAGVTTNVDGSVVSWLDQSGKGNHAVQDPVYLYPTPRISMDTNTARPALYFDANTTYLLVSNAPSLALTNDMSLFYGASFEDFAAVRSICGKTSIAVPHPFDYYVNAAGAEVMVRGDERGSTAVASSVRPVPAGAFVFAGVTVQGSFGAHFLQGVSNGSGSFGYGAIDDGTDLLIGTRDARDIYFKGNLSELLLYSRALSDTDVVAANSYLAGRYGIATAQLSTQPPSLKVSQTSPGAVQLSWLPGYAGYVLEARTNLVSGAWTSLATNPPNNQVIVGTTNQARFFRLRQQ